MSKSSQVRVQEVRRQIVFKSGARLDLHNVSAFDPSGTWLRLWSDEGMSLINPDAVDYHMVKADIRADDQEKVNG